MTNRCFILNCIVLYLRPLSFPFINLILATPCRWTLNEQQTSTVQRFTRPWRSRVNFGIITWPKCKWWWRRHLQHGDNYCSALNAACISRNVPKYLEVGTIFNVRQYTEHVIDTGWTGIASMGFKNRGI